MKFFDLKKQYQSIKEEIDSAISQVLDKSDFIGGSEVESFEKEIAQYCGTEYAISVNSGTDALLLSLKALGIGSGDEVITSPFTYIAAAEVISALGAKPVFVDIEEETFNIDVLKIEEKITDKTKAIIPVHLFGRMAKMDKIIEISQKHNIYIIEDSAQAIGASYNGKKAGSFGVTGCFSFFPTKNLGAYGDGGMITTDNKELKDKIELLKNHGASSEDKYLHLTLGTNSRLDVIQAAILRVKLKHLDEWNQKRREIAEKYNELNVGDIVTPDFDKSDVYHQYTIRTKQRDELKEYLDSKGVPTKIYYSLPLHLQPAFKNLGYNEGDFPVAEKVSKEVLSLPIYPELEEEQNKVIIEITNFYGRKA